MPSKKTAATPSGRFAKKAVDVKKVPRSKPRSKAPPQADPNSGERLSKQERFARMVEIAVRFDQHCREASALRDALRALAVSGGLSPEDENRILLDAHLANESKAPEPRRKRVLVV